MDFDSEVDTLDTWNSFNVSITEYAGASYGLTSPYTVALTGASAGRARKVGALSNVASGSNVKIRAYVAAGQGNTVDLRVMSDTSSDISRCAGDMSSVALAFGLYGTGHTCSSTLVDGSPANDIYRVDFTMTADETSSLSIQVGPNTTVSGDSVHVLGIEAWDDISTAYLEYPISMSVPEAPTIEQVNFESVGAGNYTAYATGSINGGTFYFVDTTSTTAPSAVQVVAGKDHTGADATRAYSQAVTGNAFSYSYSANPEIQHCGYFVYSNGGANSAVSSGGCVDAQDASTNPKRFSFRYQYNGVNTDRTIRAPQKFFSTGLFDSAEDLEAGRDGDIDYFHFFTQDPTCLIEGTCNRNDIFVATAENVDGIEAGQIDVLESHITAGNIAAYDSNVPYWFFGKNENPEIIAMGVIDLLGYDAGEEPDISDIPGTTSIDEGFETATISNTDPPTPATIGSLRGIDYFDHTFDIVTYNSGDAPASGPTGSSGTKAIRIELRPTDLNDSNVYRAEIFTQYNDDWKVEKTNWASWWIYVPANFDPGEMAGGQNLIIGQVHGNGPNGPVSTITLQECNNNQSPIGFCWNVMGKRLVDGSPKAFGITIGGNNAIPFTQRGQWVNLKYQFKASQSGNGVINVWVDDELIGTMSGNVGIVMNDDPYWKAGLYHKGENTMVMFIDDILLTNED